ncbi:DUF6493 family protein [Dactylosporangium sp. NPDC005555]|uniref:DUF6493 family protein n=1 Tax=Dactylosporangium sp. NPDC005555 TaxID=3154889 RepID=UPI00339E1B72
MSLFGPRRSGPIDWPALQTMLQKGNFAATVDALRDLDEPQRAELGKELVALRRDAGTWFNEQQATAYAVAAVGCASTAAKAVTVITRHGWPWSSIRTQPVLRAAADRGAPWLGELATRMADKLPRDAGFFPWRFTSDLLLAAGVPAPTGERFVDGWLLSVQASRRERTVLDAMRDSPFTDTLLPVAFERDGIAAAGGTYDQATGKWQTTPDILLAVATLTEEGRFPRADALDRCLDALLGSRPTAVLHAFVRFHDALAPTGSEIAERVTIYLKLLADAAGSVATMAQKVLKAADAAGALELESLLDASRTVLARSEKGLIKAQLIWLEKLAKRLPARAAEIAEVVAVATDHPDVQSRDRAAAFLARHGTPTTPAGPQVAAPVPDLLTAAVVADMPDPITSPDELAEEIAVLDQADWETVPFERVLAALVRMHAADPVGLRAAIAPVMQRAGNRIGNSWWAGDAHRHAGALLTAALNKAAGLPFVLDGAARLLRGTPADVQLSNSYAKLHGVLMLRIAEIVVRLSTEPVPALVATPTQVNGLLDPAALVERLARAEREGWQPWKRDLRQALYRLPADVDPATLRQARTLRSDAGRTLVEWLEAGGVGTPDVRVVRVHRQHAERGRYLDWLPESRFYAASTPARSGLDPYWLTELTPPAVVNADHGSHSWAALWPAVLPTQREVVAACLLPLIAGSADLDSSRGDARLLPLLAEVTGPVGPATLTAVAYGLAASQADERIAALDALMALAALSPATSPAHTSVPVSPGVSGVSGSPSVRGTLTPHAAAGASPSHAAAGAFASSVAPGGSASPASPTAPGAAVSLADTGATDALNAPGAAFSSTAQGAAFSPTALDASGSPAAAGAVVSLGGVGGADGDGGSGGFDGRELGAQLARMVGTKLIVLSRAVAQLEDAARIAPAMTWQVAAGALGELLPAEHAKPAAGPVITPPAPAITPAGPMTRVAARIARAAANGGVAGASAGGAKEATDGKSHVTPRGLPDLLTLASTAAAASGSRGEVPGLAELAARKGSTRLVVEAKRLHRTLNPG